QEIHYGRAFAKKLRIRRKVELELGANLASDFLNFATCTHGHGRLCDEHGPPIDRSGDLFGRGEDETQVSMAVPTPARRTDCNKYGFCARHGRNQLRCE